MSNHNDWASGLPAVPTVDLAEMAQQLGQHADEWEAGAGTPKFAHLRFLWPTLGMEGQGAFDCCRTIHAAATAVLGQPPSRGAMADVFTRGDGPTILRQTAQQLDQLRAGRQAKEASS